MSGQSGTYRKRPVEIEAYRFDNRLTNPPPHWLHHAIDQGRAKVVFDGLGAPQHMEIQTLEGTMRANLGDWIIKGVEGELYPCKPNIFEATYEAAESPE